MPTKFDPNDPTTFPPRDEFVLWGYKDNNKQYQYIVASVERCVNIHGQSYLFFTPSGISGWEWECDLNTYTPDIWQSIPSFLEQSND